MPHLNRKRNWCNGANKSYDKSNYGDCPYILIKTALIQWLRRFYCVWLSQLTKLSSCPARWAPGLTPVARCSGVLSSPHPHNVTHNVSIPRYWLVLTMVFLSELFLDQLNLSPTFTLIKLAFMFWCVAPMEYNGSHVIYEKVTFQQ